MSLIAPFEIGIWNAWIFTIWMIISPFLSSILIKDKGIVKQLRASAPMKHEKKLNVLSMAAVIFGFIYSIFLPLKTHTLWFYIGLLIFVIGISIEFSVLWALTKSKIDKPFTRGPYKYSRHPIYISLLLITSSVSIMSLSWVFLLVLLILFIHLLRAVPAEENYCLKKYGKEYKEYIKKTPRWFGLPKS
jgi:protein-S-isoprenylcysteine O-methyltransferase Ste14